MHIAQVAPLYESVPPKGYGGTERIVSYLTEALVQSGHKVTLYASGDSQTAAHLRAICPRSLRLDDGCVDQLAHHVHMLERVRQDASEYDLIHFHIDYLHFPLSRLAGWPHLTTLHGRLDLPDLHPLYRAFPDMPVVSISDAQRTPLPFADWRGTVHHGLPTDLLQFDSKTDDYLVFVGRISAEKRVDRAIAIAEEAGLTLRIAAKVDPADRAYFEREIRPLLSAPHVDFIGEISDADKSDFVGRARGLLFPIDWPEPFGLVMIEALACGTPVIAFKNGSVPEVIDHGETGFIVKSIEEATNAVARLDEISRAHCRRVFEKRFSAHRMAADYLALYERIASRPTPPS